jgi:integrase
MPLPLTVSMSKKSGLPKYTFQDRNRSGSPRVVFRRPGQPKVVLPGPPLSERFWSAYFAAIGGKQIAARKRQTVARKALPNSLRALCDAYFKSGSFRQYDEATQRDKIGVLESILREPLEPGKQLVFADCAVKSFNRRLVGLLRDRKWQTPSAANKRLKYLRRMLQWAISEGRLEGNNPVDGVERMNPPKRGFHTWTLDEAHCYLRTHPIGTKAYLAFALTLVTGMRVSDLSQVGWQHIDKQGGLSKGQHKNRKRDAKVIEFKIPGYLLEIIDQSPTGKENLLETENGRPFTIKGMANKVKEWCVEAGIPHCSAHGIRKLASVISAENDGSSAQMKALFGWSSSRQADPYIEKANKKSLSDQAVEKVGPVFQVLLTGKQVENEIAPLRASAK